MSKTTEQLSNETARLDNGALTTENVPSAAAPRVSPTRTPPVARPSAVLFVDPDHQKVVPSTLGLAQLAVQAHAATLFVARVVPSKDGNEFSIVPFLPGQQGEADEYALPIEHAREMGVLSVVGPASSRLLRVLQTVQVRTAGEEMAAIGIDAAGAEVFIGTQYAGYSSGVAAHLGGLRGQVDWMRATSRRVASAAKDILGGDTEVTYQRGPSIRDLTPEAAMATVPSREVITMLTRSSDYAQELVSRGTERVERGRVASAGVLRVKTHGIEPIGSAPSPSLSH